MTHFHKVLGSPSLCTSCTVLGISSGAAVTGDVSDIVAKGSRVAFLVYLKLSFKLSSGVCSLEVKELEPEE